MSLATYRRKRDFAKTPEPSGDEGQSQPPEGDRRFVVQRHRASRLHYDFRLEIDGVLMSWAVPKGPSLNPGDKRMAVHVEDHPLSYFDFEGVIPKGEYGGGDVIVWDWGTWEPEEADDPAKAVRSGELKFRLDGKKLRGRFTLVKIRSNDPEKDDWLLIHKKDEDADTSWDVDQHARSVKTGRTNDEVLAGADAVWDSNAPADEAAIDLSGARKEKLPEFVEPMKATAIDQPFDDEDWLFELKLDGYRIEAVIDGPNVRLWTRNKQDAARYFPDLASARPTWVMAETAIVDGEVVALDQQGVPQFSLLQDRAGMGRFGPRGVEPDERRERRKKSNFVAPVVYYAFDLIHHDGRSLIDVPLEERKKLLRSVLREHDLVRFGSHIPADGKDFYEVVRKQGLEGIVAKLRTSLYEPGRRSRSWLKIKIRREQEAVVVGYEPGKGTHADIGSLILAVNEDGELRYVGEVGSGLNSRTRQSLKAELDAHAVDTSPVVNAPRLKSAHWSEPRLVVRVEFSEWTTDGYLRQAAYKGLDIGKDPRAVVREREVSADEAVEEAEDAAQRPRRKSAAARVSASAGKSGAPRKSAGRGVSAASGKLIAERKPATRKSVAAHDPFLEDPDDRSDPPQAATAEEMAALEALGKDGTWSIGGETISLSNLDKVLFPEPGFTKRDLIRYYVTISPVMLPYLQGRALNLWRWPDGVTGKSFWQKQVPSYTPKWITRWDYPEAGSSESHTYLVADRVATMAWLANHATIDVHPWTSGSDAYRTPTYALIDIDPGPKTTFDELVMLAKLYRAALDHLAVKAWPKVTGKRGIQIWVPVKPIYTYEDTRLWVEAISRAIGSTVPNLVSWEWGKSARGGKARLDFTQNAINKTLVAPYAARPVATASVSTPIDWDELDDAGLRPDGWNIRTILDRVRERGDLFRPVLEVNQELPPVG
ncbi:MAG: non-homologous end-joining DNA ligase [Candidatus Limnocylindrales bacterium]